MSAAKYRDILDENLFQSALDLRLGRSYSPSSDLDVFLHGLGLEHLAELLKENDLTLRQLLYLEESELKKAGITDVKDCKKIMAAMKEIHVEDTKLGKLPSLSKLESSDELFAFLLRLNRQCNAISHAVVAVSGQIPSNPQKVVFEWDNSQNFTTVCEDILTSITELNKEVCGLQDRLTKLESLAADKAAKSSKTND
ncbi:unnamed protein product [Ranitomeya imitator]|uniref:SAM domain-containing protein n=1 Tax=Ranitomeya imitator TaxID=111125 RepID=A0ABN9M3H6_9NEOB|nr:unnamed protein product [Ranitomeya imitator]